MHKLLSSIVCVCLSCVEKVREILYTCVSLFELPAFSLCSANQFLFVTTLQHYSCLVTYYTHDTLMFLTKAKTGELKIHSWLYVKSAFDYYA